MSTLPMSDQEIAAKLGMTNKRAAGCVYVVWRSAVRKLWMMGLPRYKDSPPSRKHCLVSTGKK